MRKIVAEMQKEIEVLKEQIKKAEAEGSSVDEAVMEAAHG